MPKALEQKLKREAKKKFPKNKERQNVYVYGTLLKTGWTPTKRKTKKVIKKKTKKNKKKKTGR